MTCLPMDLWLGRSKGLPSISGWTRCYTRYKAFCRFCGLPRQTAGQLSATRRSATRPLLGSLLPGLGWDSLSQSGPSGSRAAGSERPMGPSQSGSEAVGDRRRWISSLARIDSSDRRGTFWFSRSVGEYQLRATIPNASAWCRRYGRSCNPFVQGYLADGRRSRSPRLESLGWWRKGGCDACRLRVPCT